MDGLSPSRFTESVERAVARAREELDLVNGRREWALKAVRDVIASSGRAVNLLVSGRIEEASEELEALERAKRVFDDALGGRPELVYSGFAISAYAEYVEAVALSSLLRKGVVPSPDELGVHPTAYLLGLADLIGELRRISLEKVRVGRLDEAFAFLYMMESLFLLLASLDYPDALVPGLRHKIDVARRSIDETRALLVDISNRERLREALERVLQVSSAR